MNYQHSFSDRLKFIIKELFFVLKKTGISTVSIIDESNKDHSIQSSDSEFY